MVNFCYHNIFRPHVFPLQNASFTSVLAVIAPPKMPACTVLLTRMKTAAVDMDILWNAQVLHASDVALWAGRFILKGKKKKAIAERESRPRYQRAALKSKPFRAWSVQTSTFAAVEVFWHLCSPECRMNQLWHCTMFIVFHPYFPKCGEVWKHLKRECQQGDGRFPSERRVCVRQTV